MAFIQAVQHAITIVIELLIGATLSVRLLVGGRPRALVDGIDNSISVRIGCTDGFNSKSRNNIVHDRGGMGFVEEDVLVDVRSDGASAVTNGEGQKCASTRTGRILDVGQSESFFVRRDLTKNRPSINGVNRDAEFGSKIDDDVGQLVVVVDHLVSNVGLL